MTQPDADLLAELVRQLHAQPTLDAVWELVVHAAVTHVAGAEHAGITMLSRRSVSTPVATSDLAREIDDHQYAAGEGPCLTAARQSQPVVRVDDLSTDPRWPQITDAATHLGVRSVLSVQLYTDAGTIGALNVYAARASGFTDESVHTGVLLAAHVAVVAAAMIKIANLRIALESRDVIGQAKGILMNRYKITADRAFQLLGVASANTNRKLRDVAAYLTETGELPSKPGL